jgi:prepilin-type N-terminal cleavage/methylation domain-containing protein
MKRTNQNQGFTIVEMLTVMGIIAILIGLLLPALNQVKDYSRQIQQKAQFHSIDPGLEMFKNDFGSYPESKDNAIAPLNAIDATPYCGANKLAEAMVGLDLLGFHPKSGFTANGKNNVDSGAAQLIYDPINGITGGGTPPYTETAAQNIACRKKYIDLESANAFQMQDVYASYGTFLKTSFVLCDVYARKRASGKKAGMPILYFKARTSYQFQDYTDTSLTPGGVANDIYYIYDNTNLLALNSPEDTTVKHPLWDVGDATDYKDFEDMILNKQVQNATQAVGGVKRPYRADSYILISAGKDGLYGTADDLFNFEKSAEQ